MNTIFSVIMPCYKTEATFIRRAIDSVVRQTYLDWELVFVDDNNADSSFKRMSQQLAVHYKDDNRIKFLFHDDNLGANAARNTAISASSGNWLAFLDADDYWDTDYLQNVNDRIKETGCRLVSTPIRIYDGVRTRTMPSQAHGNGFFFESELMGDLLSPSSGICAEKEALLDAGGFDEGLPARQDYDMWLRLSRSSRIAFCERTAVTVVRDGHESISAGYQRHLAGTEAIIRKIKQDTALDNKLRERALRSQYAYLARYLALNGQKRLAKEYLLMAGDYASTKLRLMVNGARVLPYLRSASHFVRYKKTSL